MLFVIAGQGTVYLYALWRRRGEPWPDRWAGFTLGFCGAGLLTLFLHALVLPQIRSGMEHTVSVVQAWKNPLWTALEIIRGLGIDFFGVAAAMVALGVIAAGVWSFARQRPEVLLLLFVPPLLGAGYVVGVGHHLWPRFFFFVFGFAALVAVRGAMVIEGAAAGLLRRGGVREKGVLCAVMVLVSAVSAPRAFAPKQDYEGAIAFVKSVRQPGDTVLTAGLIAYPYDNLYKPGWPKVTSLEQLNSLRAASRRTIVLCTLKPVLEATDPEIAASLQHDFRLLRTFPGTLENGAVYVYVAGQPQAASAAMAVSSQAF